MPRRGAAAWAPRSSLLALLAILCASRGAAAVSVADVLEWKTKAPKGSQKVVGIVPLNSQGSRIPDEKAGKFVDPAGVAGRKGILWSVRPEPNRLMRWRRPKPDARWNVRVIRHSPSGMMACLAEEKAIRVVKFQEKSGGKVAATVALAPPKPLWRRWLPDIGPRVEEEDDDE